MHKQKYCTYDMNNKSRVVSRLSKLACCLGKERQLLIQSVHHLYLSAIKSGWVRRSRNWLPRTFRPRKLLYIFVSFLFHRLHLLYARTSLMFAEKSWAMVAVTNYLCFMQAPVPLNGPTSLNSCCRLVQLMNLPGSTLFSWSGASFGSYDFRGSYRFWSNFLFWNIVLFITVKIPAIMKCDTTIGAR